MKPVFIVFIGIYMAIFSLNSFAWGEEKYCSITEVTAGKCSKGDLLIVLTPIIALKFCDFEKNIVSFPRGDASDINGTAICFYRGSEREKR